MHFSFIFVNVPFVILFIYFILGYNNWSGSAGDQRSFGLEIPDRKKGHQRSETKMENA